MHVLVVKTSSLGDVIHTLPALSDALRAIPEIRFDWVVEEAFAEVPAWHPAVERVIPVALRRWRKQWRKAYARGEIGVFLRHLRERPYQHVIDAQGLLLKSGLLAALARGPASGYDRRSAREPWVSWSYRRRHAVPRALHAVQRSRQLFALALGYTLANEPARYGIRRLARPQQASRPHLLFLHATTWPSKHWPSLYWAELTHLAQQAGYRVLLPWQTPEDRLQAERIMHLAAGGELLARQNLAGLAAWLGAAAGVVGVDSGLAHLAAALEVPAITLYGPTRLQLTGALGPAQRNLAAVFPCAPCLQRECAYRQASAVQPACFTSLPPAAVWAALDRQINPAERCDD
jgi:heptosyltransferase-1